MTDVECCDAGIGGNTGHVLKMLAKILEEYEKAERAIDDCGTDGTNVIVRYDTPAYTVLILFRQ